MTPNLLDELEKIVALSEKATPGPWRFCVVESREWGRSGCGASIFGKGFASGGRPVIADLPPRTVHGSHGDNAELISAAVNFLRTHAPALADMAKRLEAAERDAARYRWLRYAANISWNGWVTYENLMATEQERAEMDAAIDRAMEISPLLPVDAATQEGAG